MKRTFFLILVVALLAGCNKKSESNSEPSAPRPKSDVELIQGTWVYVSSEHDGKPVPADELKDLKWIITDKQLTVKSPEGQPGKAVTMDYKIDSTKSPKEIDYEEPFLTVADNTSKSSSSATVKKTMTWKGIYALDGDTLKLCFSRGFSGPERPTEFTTRPGGSTELIVLKREKK